MFFFLLFFFLLIIKLLLIMYLLPRTPLNRRQCGDQSYLRLRTILFQRWSVLITCLMFNSFFLFLIHSFHLFCGSSFLDINKSGNFHEIVAFWIRRFQSFHRCLLWLQYYFFHELFYFFLSQVIYQARKVDIF